MSHKEDHCFQCQESGHITHHCPNVQCFECDEYGHIVMDCPHRIPPSGTPAHHYRPKSHSSHAQDQPHATIMKTDTDAISLDLNPILTDITAKVIMTPTEAIPGHTTGITDDITGVVHNAHIQPLTHIILTMTIHITDHLHIEALQLTPEITTDHALDQPTKPPRKPCTDLHHIPADHMTKHTPKGT